MEKTKGRAKLVYQSLPAFSVQRSFLLGPGQDLHGMRVFDLLSDQIGKRVSLWPPLIQKGRQKRL